MKKIIKISSILILIFALTISIMPSFVHAKTNKKVVKAYEREIRKFRKYVTRMMSDYKVIVKFACYDIDRNGIPELYLTADYYYDDGFSGQDRELCSYRKGKVVTLYENTSGGGQDFLFDFGNKYFIEADRGACCFRVYKLKNGKKIKVKEFFEPSGNQDRFWDKYDKNYKKYLKKGLKYKIKMHKATKKNIKKYM